MKELTKIQLGIHAPKDKRGGGQASFAYRSCEQILEAVKPLLKSTNCNIILNDELMLVGNQIYLKATATLVNDDGECASASAYAKEPERLAAMSAPQITGSCSSYARKYALCGLLAIDGTDARDEVDAQPQVYETAQPAQQQPAQQQQEQASPYAAEIAIINAIKSRAELVTYCNANPEKMEIKEIFNALAEVGKKYPRTTTKTA